MLFAATYSTTRNSAGVSGDNLLSGITIKSRGLSGVPPERDPDLAAAATLTIMLALEIFAEYVAWLRVNLPHAYENLAPPATPAELDALERHLGRGLPAEVKAVLAVHNGQRATDISTHIAHATPCLPTLSFLSTAMIKECWDQWRPHDDDPDIAQLQAMGGVFPGAEGVIKPLYVNPGWIPLWSDPVRSDYIGLDLDPGPDGASGQIINFGRDEERHYLCADDFTDLLRFLLDQVRSGAWPATEIDTEFEDGTWRMMPWFGDPDDHFFNALYERFEAARSAS